jgi:transposase InsO family protein
VQDGERLSLVQIRAFLEGSQELQFEARDRAERYRWMERTLVEQEYARLGRRDKGLVRMYVAKMTGLGRAQVTRLIRQYRQAGEVRAPAYRRHRFATRYLSEDIALLSEVDEAHDTLSGPATQALLRRAYYEFHDTRFVNLADISVAHLYRLRARRSYVVGATAQISEAFLIPVLEAMLEQFPFPIRGFHSDCGSEFINHTVARLLNKLLIEQTKSRPRHSNDNGLAEAKNGAVVRKHMGHWHIAAGHAEAITRFYGEFFNPYLNFHRPCAVAEMVEGPKGKRERVYRWYATPWQILRQLPGVAGYLRPSLTIETLDGRAAEQTDIEAAQGMQQAKRRLFARFEAPRKRTA